MVKKNSKVLLTLPCLQDQGGVASFYNAVLPHMLSSILPLEIGGTKGKGGFLHSLIDQLRFQRSLKRAKPALVYINPSLNFNSFLRDGLFAWQAKRHGYPLLVFWHGWDKVFEVAVEKQLLWFFRHSIGQADGFIVLASAFERKLREWGVRAPIYRETTTVDENLLADFDASKKWQSFHVTSPVNILFLARLERAKGVFETIQAVKLLEEKGLSVSLTIAGGGEILQELKEHAYSLNMSPQQVNFTGDIRGKDKIRAFTEHHIYCFPTFYGEGLPTSVLEAMAFGMPVITRPVGGLADMFEDEKMGRLVLSKSPVEIANCLEQLITNKDKMVEIGRYNHAYAKEHFMAPVVAKRLEEIYTEILRTRQTPSSK